MKKLLIAIIIIIIAIAIIYCFSFQKNEEVEENTSANEVAETEETAKPEGKIDVEATIKSATKEYFDMICEDEVEDVKVNSIKIYDGTEPMADYVDLDEYDYML